MAGLLSTSQPVGEQFQATLNTGGSALSFSVVDSSALPSGPVAPFKATFYVDPGFAGTQLGSQSNPFTTVAAAFAAALAQSLTRGQVLLPPGVTVTENVVFPNAGANWEIACAQSYGYLSAANTARINGTVLCDSTTPCTFSLARIAVTGTISGNATGGNCALSLSWVASAAVTTTVTGGNLWIVSLAGNGIADQNGGSGRCTGAVSVAGQLYAVN